MSNLFAILLLSPTVHAGEPLPRGELVTITTSVAAEHSYVLYLPTGYHPNREWPILYCLDARSRGELVARLFQPAAEEHGWILACSNNTASDGPFEPNLVAMRYLWSDTHVQLSIDDARIYATGFSGVSRFLWHFPAMKLPLAGAIGVGGSTPWKPIPEMSIPFVYYGIAGDRDFNWAEMVELDAVLEDRGVPHRLAVFDGAHGWPDSGTAVGAVRWMELRAVRDELAEADASKIESWLAADLRMLREMIDLERHAEALDLAESIRRDYEGLVDEALLPETDSEILRADGEARERLARDELAWMADMRRPIATLLDPGRTRGEQFRARRELDIEGWKKRAERRDRTASHSAARRLSWVFGQLSFYVPNLFLERGEPARAMSALDLASEIDPDAPGLLYQRARVLVRLGRHDESVDELARLVESGYPVSRLAADEEFAALRGHERFKTLTEKERENDRTDIE